MNWFTIFIIAITTSIFTTVSREILVDFYKLNIKSRIFPRKQYRHPEKLVDNEWFSDITQNPSYSFCKFDWIEESKIKEAKLKEDWDYLSDPNDHARAYRLTTEGSKEYAMYTMDR